MIYCLDLNTSVGSFYAHYFKGNSGHLFVFVPGLMEPKAGLFYIWMDMARHFHEKGHSCLLLDLGGQGDSLLPLSFTIWQEQRMAILDHFTSYEIHFVIRGIGSIFLTPEHVNFAISPSLRSPVVEQLSCIRWTESPFSEDCFTLQFADMLSDTERSCFYHLGAEVECIGGLQLPKSFVKELPCRLPSHLPSRSICYWADEAHPLFDKKSEREALIEKIAVDFKRIYEPSNS